MCGSYEKQSKFLQLIPLRASSATTIASVKSAPIQLSATSHRTLPPSLDGLPPTATGRINIDDEVIEVSEYIASFSRRGGGGTPG